MDVCLGKLYILLSSVSALLVYMEFLEWNVSSASKFAGLNFEILHS